MHETRLAAGFAKTPFRPRLLRLGDDADVGLGLFPLAEDLLGLVVVDGPGDDHVLALLPVDRRGDLVVRGQLKRVDHAEHLVEVAPGGHRVDEDQLHLLVRADDEHVADGLVVGGRAVGGVAGDVGAEHPVRLGDFEVVVADDRVVRARALCLFDVVGPEVVLAGRVDREADDLRVALVELGLDLGHVAELGGADRSEVLGVGEEDCPPVSDPLVELDLALGRLRREVRRGVTDRQCHLFPPRYRSFASLYKVKRPVSSGFGCRAYDYHELRSCSNAASNVSCGCAPSTRSRRSSRKAGTPLTPIACASAVDRRTRSACRSDASTSSVPSSPTAPAIDRRTSWSPMSCASTQYASIVRSKNGSYRSWARACSASRCAS